MSHAFSWLQVLAAVTRAFSAVLAHMDRNAGIRLLNEEGLRARWISLFQVSPVGLTCHLYLGALDRTRFYYNIVFEGSGVVLNQTRPTRTLASFSSRSEDTLSRSESLNSKLDGYCPYLLSLLLLVL